MNAATTAPAAPNRAVVTLLLLVGSCLLTIGVSGPDPWVGGGRFALTLFVWTTLVPRLRALRGVELFFAAHGIAVGTFLAASLRIQYDLMLIGNPYVAGRELRTAFAYVLASGGVGLGIALGLDRLVRTRGALARHALVAILALLALALVPLWLATRGEGRSEMERLAELPVTSRIAPGVRRVEVPELVLRDLRGDVLVPGPLAPRLEQALAANPALADAPLLDRARVFVRDADNRVCDRLGTLESELEVRRVAGMLLLTEPHAFEGPNPMFAMGCAWHPELGTRDPVRASMLARPITARGAVPLLAASMVVAALQLVLALWAVYRHARVARAKEAIADGSGAISLPDGSIARTSDDVAEGPVLVALTPASKQSYRESAQPAATVLDRGTHELASSTMHLSTSMAVLAAIGALVAVEAQLVQCVLSGEVIAW